MRLIRYVYSKSISDVIKYFKDRKSVRLRKQRQFEAVNRYLSGCGDQPKLQIGGGSMIIAGWLNTDLLETEKVMYLDAAGEYPCPDNSFQFIFAEHLFEHLSYSQETAMLKECLRILKPGGTLRMAMPCVEFLQRILAGDPATDAYVNWACQTMRDLAPVHSTVATIECRRVYVVNNFYRDWGHQTIHSRTTLKELLLYNGFANPEFCNVGFSRHKSLCTVEHHMNSIPAEFNLMETMIVEAEKPQA